MVTPASGDTDHFHDECGVFGVFGHPDAAALTVALGLHALQHRGQEAAGIVAYDGEQFHAHRGWASSATISAPKDVIGGCAARRDRP
jgi:amidophosphoribosyltransferase